jgi:uncharacterized membrane protein YeiH
MTIIQIITYTGIFVFAVTGALKARTHRMDIFGASVLAFATAYGGGTIRDLLIGIRPVSWINNYITLGLVLSAVVIVFLFNTNMAKFQKAIFISDAIGLGLFSAVGIEVSMKAGINDGYAIILGVITATFGGLIADILCSQVPNLLRRGELYATTCFVGGTVYVILQHYIEDDNINLIICIGIVVAMRILSKLKRLELPEI